MKSHIILYSVSVYTSMLQAFLELRDLGKSPFYTPITHYVKGVSLKQHLKLCIFKFIYSPASGLCGSITNNIIYCAHSFHWYFTDQNVHMYYNSTDQNVPNYTSRGINLLPYMVVLGTEPSLINMIQISEIVQFFKMRITYIWHI